MCKLALIEPLARSHQKPPGRLRSTTGGFFIGPSQRKGAVKGEQAGHPAILFVDLRTRAEPHIVLLSSRFSEQIYSESYTYVQGIRRRAALFYFSRVRVYMQIGWPDGRRIK